MLNRSVGIMMVILASLVLVRAGDAEEKAQPPVRYMPEHAGIGIQLATQGHSMAAGLDLDASYLLTNAGINVRSWSGDGKSEVTVYAGVGFGQILQLQAGYSSSASLLLRLRSDYPLAPLIGSWELFNKGKYWMATPVIEIPLTAHHGVVYGLGLGRMF